MPELRELLANGVNVAFGGTAGSGKTTAADIVLNGYPRYRKQALAAPIKEIASRYLPGYRDRRTAYQTIGETLRTLEEKVWIDYLLGSARPTCTVVDDVRLEVGAVT